MGEKYGRNIALQWKLNGQKNEECKYVCEFVVELKVWIFKTAEKYANICKINVLSLSVLDVWKVDVWVWGLADVSAKEMNK